MSVLFFLCDGRGFLLGVAVLFLTTILSLLDKHPMKFLCKPFAALGFLLIVFSATPLSIWFYIFWLVAIVIMLATPKERRKLLLTSQIAVLVLCIGAICSEIPYLRLPKLPTSSLSKTKLYVVGDSISAGIHPQEKVWCKQLQKEYKVNVTNLSIPGATCTSAVWQAQKITKGPGMVLLEIGGNDIFGEAAYQDYENGLRHLLQNLQNKNLRLVMFGLPAPPLQNKYSEIQRRLAKEYKVALIPRWYFTEILASSAHTTDGIHLSEQGHKQMAKLVWQLLYKKL